MVTSKWLGQNGIHNSPIDHTHQQDVQDEGPHSELLPVLYKLQIMGVPLPPPAMEAVQVVVPHQRDRRNEDGRQNQIANGQTKQIVLLRKGTGCVDVSHPDVHKQLDDVNDCGEGP